MDASTIIVLALLLACPLMMLFMHRGHGEKHSMRETDHGDQDERNSAAPRSAERSLDAEITHEETARR